MSFNVINAYCDDWKITLYMFIILKPSNSKKNVQTLWHYISLKVLTPPAPSKSTICLLGKLWSRSVKLAYTLLNKLGTKNEQILKPGDRVRAHTQKTHTYLQQMIIFNLCICNEHWLYHNLLLLPLWEAGFFLLLLKITSKKTVFSFSHTASMLLLCLLCPVT